MAELQVWKDVPRYEGLYQVSSNGEVRSQRKILVPVLHPTTGRYVVTLHKDDGQKTVQVHSLVLLAFSGPAPSGYVARHLNGNPLDNRIDNLVWGTYQENADDCLRHGTRRFGERHPQAKLTENQVREIRALKGKVGSRRLARVYSVDRKIIDLIRANKIWRYVS